MHDTTMCYGSKHLVAGARRQRRPMRRLLPVRVWWLDQNKYDTARRVSLGHVRNVTSQESARHQEPTRYVDATFESPEGTI